MPVFVYQAVDARGISQAGEIVCGTRASALTLLQQQGLTPLALDERARAESRAWLKQLHGLSLGVSPKSLNAKQVVTLTQSLAALLKAGMTIDRALAITANLNRQASAREVLGSLGRAVRAGSSFAKALSESKLVLPAYYVGMVQAGEAGGSLPQTLVRLANLMRKQQEVRDRIHSALIYPALLGTIVLLTMVLLLAFVLPRFEQLFAEADAQLPWATRAVLNVGGFVSSYWWALLAIGTLAIVGGMMFLRSPRGRERMDTWLLMSRCTFGLPASIDTARLLRTLSTLLANGVQIGSAMRVARATLTNSRLRRALDEATQRVKAGESISAALHATGVFPAQAVQLARVGEETGRLEDLLSDAASILEDESSASLERFLALLVPGLTILMGLLIAGLIGSVLIGLLSVNELAF